MIARSCEKEMSRERLPALAAATTLATTTAAAAGGGAWLVAIAAIDWPILARLERHLRLTPAVGASCRVHLPLRTRAAKATARPILVFACGAAIRAASGRMSKPLRSVESLFPSGKHKLLTAVAALQGLVAIRS